MTCSKTSSAAQAWPTASLPLSSAAPGLLLPSPSASDAGPCVAALDQLLTSPRSKPPGSGAPSLLSVLDCCGVAPVPASAPGACAAAAPGVLSPAAGGSGRPTAARAAWVAAFIAASLLQPVVGPGQTGAAGAALMLTGGAVPPAASSSCCAALTDARYAAPSSVDSLAVRGSDATPAPHPPPWTSTSPAGHQVHKNQRSAQRLGACSNPAKEAASTETMGPAKPWDQAVWTANTEPPAN